MTTPQARRPRAASSWLAASLAVALAGCGAASSGDGGGNHDPASTNVAPVITSPPASQTVVAGQTASFSVVASGNPAPSYQWQKNGSSVSGATSDAYTTPATSTSDSGSTFRVVVSNAAGAVTSDSATLTVDAVVSKPVISSFSASPSSMSAGHSSTLSWSISGATSASIAGTAVDAQRGSLTVKPSSTTTYTLTASSSAGSSSATTTVTVNTTGPGSVVYVPLTPASGSGSGDWAAGQVVYDGGENMIVKDVLGADMVAFVRSSTGALSAAISQDDGDSWRWVATGLTLRSGQGAIAQDPSGRIHIIACASWSDPWSYTRIALTRDGNGHVSGFTREATFSLASGGYSSSNHAQVVAGTDLSGQPVIFYSVHDIDGTIQFQPKDPPDPMRLRIVAIDGATIEGSFPAYSSGKSYETTSQF